MRLHGRCVASLVRLGLIKSSQLLWFHLNASESLFVANTIIVEDLEDFCRFLKMLKTLTILSHIPKIQKKGTFGSNLFLNIFFSTNYTCLVSNTFECMKIQGLLYKIVCMSNIFFTLVFWQKLTYIYWWKAKDPLNCKHF